MNLIEGIVGSIIAAGIVAILVAGYRRYFGRQIKITQPGNNGVLQEREPYGPGYSFAVRGTLKHLPKDHQIWLLVKDDAVDGYKPQGFSKVEHYDDGTWSGRVNGTGRQKVMIVAVIAPPTSQDYFEYVQAVWAMTPRPIRNIPAECKQRDIVRVTVPPMPGQ